MKIHTKHTTTSWVQVCVSYFYHLNNWIAPPHPRIPCPRPAQLPPCPPPDQQHRGELDTTREPGHRGAWLFHRVRHRQPPRSDHQSGLQAALLHHREPGYDENSIRVSHGFSAFTPMCRFDHSDICQPRY